MATPKTLAACADRLYTIKNLKSDLAKKVKDLDEERIEIEARLINELPKDDATGVSGKQARATILIEDVPQIEDISKVQAYVRKTGDWDIFTKALKGAHIKDLWDDGKKVPGIIAFPRAKVSLNKV